MELSTIHTLNIIALECMEAEDYHDAAIAFSSMEQELADFILDPTPLQEDKTEMDHDMVMREDTTSLQQERLQEEGEHDNFDDEEDDDDLMDVVSPTRLRVQTARFVPPQGDFFASPFTITNGDRDVQSVSSQEHSLLSVMALFHLGLCKQLQWNKNQVTKKRSSPQTSLLVEALRFYEQAYSFIFSVVNSGVAAQQQHPFLVPGNDPTLQVLMAVCANAAVVAEELALNAHIRAWSTRVACILYYVQRSSRAAGGQQHEEGAQGGDEEVNQYPAPFDSLESRMACRFFSVRVFLGSIPRNSARAA